MQLTTPLAPGSHKLLFVSQTQSENDLTPVNENYNKEKIPIISDNMGPEHDKVASQLSLVFDEVDDYLSAEILSLLNQRNATGILEFKIEYSNEDKQCYPLNLTRDEDPHTVASYMLSHDLVLVYNDKHRRWD